MANSKFTILCSNIDSDLLHRFTLNAEINNLMQMIHSYFNL